MILKTETLQKAYKIVDQVESGPGLLSSQFARISAQSKALVINLSGLVFSEISLPFSDHDAATWSFYADRRVLGGFISTVATETIELLAAKEQVTMKSGRHKIVLTPMGDISGYQQWKRSPNGRSVQLPEAIHRDLGLLSKYSPDLAALDHLSAVQIIKGYGMVASDSMILAAKLDSKVAAGMALPTGIARLIPALDCKEIVIEPSGVGLLLEYGYLYQTNSEKLIKEYPLKTIQTLVAEGQKLPAILKIKSGELMLALDYLSNFIGFGAGSGASISAFANKNILTLSLKLPSGVIEKRLVLGSLPTVLPFDESWQIEALTPWVKHIAESTKDDIVFARTDTGFQYFRSKNFILAMVGHA